MSDRLDRDARCARDMFWLPEEEPGVEQLCVAAQPGGVDVDCEIIRRVEGAPLRLHWRLGADRHRSARRLAVVANTIERVGVGIRPQRDGEGGWRDRSGKVIPVLDGSCTVDLPVTPFTGTPAAGGFPVGSGQPAEIKAVEVSLPEADRASREAALDLRRRVGCEGRVLVLGLTIGFTAALRLDHGDIVVDFPSMRRRFRPKACEGGLGRTEIFFIRCQRLGSQLLSWRKNGND